MSIRMIETELHIPRSTLSGWFKDISLTDSQKERLGIARRIALREARVKALLWHNAGKKERIVKAAFEAEHVLKEIGYGMAVQEMALAFLYLGEGSKSSGKTSLGNSNPDIVDFFISSLEKIYDLRRDMFRYYLHLRADQNPDEMLSYWSERLNVKESNFGKISIDARTVGKQTYTQYKGVCLVECGRVAIQRRLMYIAENFCKRSLCAVSSAG